MKKTDEITSVLTYDLKSQIALFVTAYQRGMAAWEEAGKIAVAIIDYDPHAAEDICAACPAMTPSIVHIFERIGRGLLLPSLAMDSTPGARGLRDLPISMQRRYETEPVPLLINGMNGTDVLLVDVKNLTQSQSRQIFAKGRIRSEGEQRAWMVEQESKSRAITHTPQAWTIKGGRVIFNKGATLSAGELATIITQITK
jgi:hypothetical protein